MFVNSIIRLCSCILFCYLHYTNIETYLIGIAHIPNHKCDVTIMQVGERRHSNIANYRSIQEKRTEIGRNDIFIQHERAIPLVFCHPTVVGGRRPLPPLMGDRSDPPPFKNRSRRQISACNVSRLKSNS